MPPGRSTRLQPVGYDRPVPVAPGIEVDFINAGHLLGSAYARVRAGRQDILFGGDLGRYGRPVLPDPTPVAEADILLVESTYGDRIHERDDDGEPLARIVNDAAARGGRLIIPSFAIGRVEEVLYWLKRLEDAAPHPRVAGVRRQPDGRGGAAVLHEPAVGARRGSSGRRRASVKAFYTDAHGRRSRPCRSRRISTASRTPAIVIASSGMATGGRVLHHLAAALPDPRNTVLFVGYQAAGTRGRVARATAPSR